MKRFQLIEHTADTGLIAYGNNLAEAFANAAYGLFSIIAELNRVRRVESQTVFISLMWSICYSKGLTSPNLASTALRLSAGGRDMIPPGTG